jgi:hypothetical protein
MNATARPVDTICTELAGRLGEFRKIERDEATTFDTAAAVPIRQ